MPKLSSLVSLGTAGKVAGGIVAGGLSTVAVQRYTDSSEFSKDPQRAEMREEGRKKLDFEIQQRSEELEKKKRELEALAETIAKQQAALKEERSAVQQMQQAATQVVASEVPVVETVQQVAQVEESEEPKSEESKKAEVPTNNAPKRPAVFDGGGNKEPIVPANDAQKPAVAFGSSGDVVTVGNADNAEMIDRLRKEIEDLRRRLAEKDGSPKEEALRAREERLRERERALSEKLWKSNMQSKATQTDDALFEAASGDDDPFNPSDSKAVKKSGRHFASAQGTDSTPKKSEAKDSLSGMKKEQIIEYAKEEIGKAAASIDAKSLARVFGEKLLSSEDAKEKKEAFCSALSASVSAPAEEETLCSVEEALGERTEQEKKKVQGWIKTLLEHSGVKGLSVVHSVRSLASVVLGSEKAKCIAPEKYAELLGKSEEEVAREMAKNFGMSNAEKQKTDKTRNEILKRKEERNKMVALKGRGEFVLPALNDALKGIKNDAGEDIAGLYDKGTRILRGYNDLQKTWEALRKTSKLLYNNDAVPPPPPPLPLPKGELSDIEVAGADRDWFDLLATADEDFKKDDDEITKPYHDAVRDYFAIKERLGSAPKKKEFTEEQVKEREDLKEQLSEMVEEVDKLANKIKRFRRAAFDKRENKLLVEHQRWLFEGLPDERNVDSVVLKAKDELARGGGQLKPSELFRMRKLGAEPRALLDEARKEQLDGFVKGVEECKKTSKTLRDKYTAMVKGKDSGFNVIKMTHGGYSVTGKLSGLGKKRMRDCLLAIAPEIEELTIEKFDAENAGEPFTNFIELCLRLKNLKHLSVKGVFGVSSKEVASNSVRAFFDKITEKVLPQRLRGCWPNSEQLFFQVLSLIPSPGLECFEMNNVNSEGKPNDTATRLLETGAIYAFIKSCKRVKLPVIESASMIKLFDLLTDGSPKDLELCTRSFAVLMQTSGFPKALYRLLKSGTTVKWFGNPGFPETGMEQLICSGGDGGIIPSPSDEKRVETLLRNQETEGKKLTDWVTDENFSKLFLEKPEVYLKLSAVHPKGFKDILIDYNEHELNPVYVACSRLTVFKKAGKDKNCKRCEVNVTDPLKGILKQYPVFNGLGSVAFGSELTVDGSSLREKILPALLNLVLREKIDGKNYTVVEVEDCNDDSGNACWWCFPSPVNDKWKKEGFSVCTSDSAFNSLSDDTKDKLFVEAMHASDNLAREADTWKNTEFKWRPGAVKFCLRGVVSDRPIFYWNKFASMAKTGKVRVSTNVPEGKPTLFNLFDTVLNAQATHEELYKAIEDTDAKYEERNKLETKVQKLKEEIETAEGDKPAKLERDLAEAEAKLQNVEKEIEALSKKAKEHENLLQPVREALEEDLPHVKEVMNGTEKKEPVRREEEGPVPVGQEEGREGEEERRKQREEPEQDFFAQRVKELFVLWNNGGRRVKYHKHGNKMTSDKVPDGRQACVNVNDDEAIRKALVSRSRKAKIEKVGEEHYLIVDFK